MNAMKPPQPFAKVDDPLPIAIAKSTSPDRRRSFRVTLGVGLRVLLDGFGPYRLTEISLGGGVLETDRKLRGGDRYRLHLDYQGSHEVLNVHAQQSSLYELFYDNTRHSRLSFRSRIVYRNPSIETLNLLYRITRDHWSPLNAYF